ncbi:MAG: transcriptional repressor [Bdellovibrionaceae bacterium]|jgi:Fur family transcriptional regulator, ferric uptake regulator|nr:transcriptional repressor [Pseudobdellovibrionaceae bacterium]
MELSSGLKVAQDKLTFDRESLTEADLSRLVREMGVKVTKQRLAILKTFSQRSAHMTAQEVFDQVKLTNPEIGFATVYRFLKQMALKGLASEVRLGGLPARYELHSAKHHDHLTCNSCGSIVEFENEDIERLQEYVAKQYGFKLTGHLLELYGLCTNCQS